MTNPDTRAAMIAARDALAPFAHAAHRINRYDGEAYDGRLFASRDGNLLTELLDGIDGDPVTMWHLRSALATYSTLSAAIDAAERAEPAAVRRAIEKVVSSAEVEWSYREDDHRTPRDFWHARISFQGFSTEWERYGEQECRELPPNVKGEAEIEQRGYLRDALSSILADHPPAAEDKP